MPSCKTVQGSLNTTIDCGMRKDLASDLEYKLIWEDEWPRLTFTQEIYFDRFISHIIVNLVCDPKRNIKKNILHCNRVWKQKDIIFIEKFSKKLDVEIAIGRTFICPFSLRQKCKSIAQQ